MSRLMLGLSEGNSISAGAAKFIVIVCLLLWVPSAAAADGGSRPEPSFTPPLALQTVNSQTGQAPIHELKQGQVIERELARGEAHTYRIALAAGQYLKVVVEQKSIDVLLRLVRADGQKLSEIDNSRVVGMESVSVVAEVSGDYRLELRSQNGDVAVGQYEIEVKELREATAKDQVYVSAQKTFDEANHLRDQRTAEARQKAVKKYEEALPLWREVGDKNGEAYTLNELGLVSAR